MSEPVLLSDDDLMLLLRIGGAVEKIKDAINRVNELAVQSCLPIRQMQKVDAALMGNDVSVLLRSHDLAVKAMREKAIERLVA